MFCLTVQLVAVPYQYHAVRDNWVTDGVLQAVPGLQVHQMAINYWIRFSAG
jgi:hypothetical protein